MSIAKCRNCETIVVSSSQNDWSCCKCFDGQNPCSRGFYLDGGDEYLRFGGMATDIIWIEPNLPGVR